MKLLNFKKAIGYFPELLLFVVIVTIFLTEWLAASRIYYPMIVCASLLLTLVVWRNKYLALAFSAILGFCSFYMIFAVVSEYKEFPPGDPDGLRLLLTGGFIFCSLFAISLFLPGKYLRGSTEPRQK